MKKLSVEIKPADEDGAWAEAVQGVKKLPEVAPKPAAPLIIDEITPGINYQKVYSGERLQPLKVGETANIDRRTAEKFKRGEWPIQRRLDLHGLTEKSAYDEVEKFITGAYRQGLRCVLIITGKGYQRESDDWYGTRGVLREQVPHWLNNPVMRPLVLAFSYALPADGGEGALYVLLRRARE